MYYRKNTPQLKLPDKSEASFGVLPVISYSEGIPKNVYLVGVQDEFIFPRNNCNEN